MKKILCLLTVASLGLDAFVAMGQNSQGQNPNFQGQVRNSQRHSSRDVLGNELVFEVQETIKEVQKNAFPDTLADVYDVLHPSGVSTTTTTTTTTSTRPSPTPVGFN